MAKKIHEHLAQAYINEQLAKHLYIDCKTRFYDKWVFVAIFYSALHYFGAFLESHGEHLPSFHKSNFYATGCIDLAKDKFSTSRNSIIDEAGTDYKQLFQWSHNVRYSPSLAQKLSPQMVDIAFSSLERVKLVTFSETGIRAKKVKKRVKVVNVNQSYIDDLARQSKEAAKRLNS